jgi:hypothetical protein
VPDPRILDATVCCDRIVVVGDAVGHFGDRSGRASARVVGFTGPDDGYNGKHVLAWPPSPNYGLCWAADRTEVRDARSNEFLPTAIEAHAQYLRALLLAEINGALDECESDFAESAPEYWAGLRSAFFRTRRMVESMVGEPTEDEKAAATRARDRELDHWAMTHGEQRL